MAQPARPVIVTGPLAEHAEGFRAALAQQGFTPLSAANQLRLMAHLSRWLANRDLGPDGLTEAQVNVYLGCRRTQGYTCWLSPRGLAPLLSYLRGEGVVPPPPPKDPSTPVDVLLADYGVYLLEERGLTPGVCAERQAVARRFFEHYGRNGALRLDSLTAGDVVGYVTSACVGRGVGSAKLEVGGLRSLLRFLHVTGGIPQPLAPAVPGVAGHRSAGLPKALAPEEVDRLLASCDRTRAVGRRDFAVLTLLSRLGLRAGEVAALSLDDVDWRAGEMTIRGKGRREECMPLPADVGRALVAYLQDGRPAAKATRLFLSARAPHRPISQTAVTGVVRQACRRAGLPKVGPHRLRHTAATEMLKAGASLNEVAQALRQRSLGTASIYAKVDRTTLRTLAQPWPEVKP